MWEHGWDLSISPGPEKPSASYVTARRSWGRWMRVEGLVFYPAGRIKALLESLLLPDWNELIMVFKNVLWEVLKSHGVFVQPGKMPLSSQKARQVSPSWDFPFPRRKIWLLRNNYVKESFLKAHSSGSTGWLISAWHNHHTFMPGAAAVLYLWILQACCFLTILAPVLLPKAQGNALLAVNQARGCWY